MKKIAIWGSSFSAKYTVDIVEQQGRYEVAFLFDPVKACDSEVYGYKIFGKEHDFAELTRTRNVVGGVVAVGDNWIRKEETERIMNLIPDFEFVNAIHPSTLLGRNAELGRGIVIMAGVIINNDASVGDGCFLATNSSLDHDSRMADYSSISANTTIGGNVVIGECSFVALGASVISDVTIGNHCVVGAGAVVVRDLADKVVAYGVPARVVGRRAIGEEYLHERGTRSNSESAKLKGRM